MPSESIKWNSRKEAPSRQYIVFVCARGFSQQPFVISQRWKASNDQKDTCTTRPPRCGDALANWTTECQKKKMMSDLVSQCEGLEQRVWSRCPTKLKFHTRKQAILCKLTFRPFLDGSIFSKPCTQQARPLQIERIPSILASHSWIAAWFDFFFSGQKKVQILLLEASQSAPACASNFVHSRCFVGTQCE